MSAISKSINIKQLEREDIPLLAKFYREYFPENPKLNSRELREWEFFKNPYVKHDNIPIYIIRDENAVYGAIGATLSHIQIDQEAYDACHPVKFFVHPSYKGLPALRLFKKMMSQYNVYYASYVSDDGAKLFEKFGFKNFNDHIKNYYFPLNTQHISTLRDIKPKKIALILYRKLLKASLEYQYKYFNRDILEYGTNMELKSEICPKVDIQKKSGKVALIKDFDYIKWRYSESPRLNCKYFHQISKNKSPLSLIIVHENHQQKKAIILDMIYESLDIKNICLNLLQVIDHYKSLGFEHLMTTGLSRTTERVTKRIGFSLYNSNYKFLFFSKDNELLEKLNNFSKWEFIIGDTDIY